jgi:hypothetical protein
MSKIGIVVLATNAYFVLGIRFIKRFDFFYKGNQSIIFHFFSDRDPKDYLPSHIKYVWHKASNSSWQDGTNMKFSSILSLSNADLDYIFYFDADTSVEKNFTEEWFLGEYVGGQHYNDVNLKSNSQREFERNPQYAGYVPLDSPYKQMYFYGAFFGGSKEKILNVCTALQDMQRSDKLLNYEPLHNDETYINKLFHYYPPSKIVLAQEFQFAISHKGGLECGRMDLDISEYLNLLKVNKNRLIDIAYKKVIVQENMKKLKVLVFTSAYCKRAYMMRQSILSGINQTYPNMVHSVNITLDKTSTTKDLSPLYEDLLNDKLIINYSDNYEHYGFSHFNNMKCIQFVPDYQSYDLFIKMDDDDIYKSKYVENIVKVFEENPEVDTVSTKIKWQLNGYDLYKGPYDNLGGNPNDSTYHMPNTFAFNKKALDCIISLTEKDVCGHDDMMWRVAWENAKLKHKAVKNDDDVIWNIHGKNTSVGGWLRQL